MRERVWRAFTNRGDNGDANDTNATIRQIVRVRAQRARLLGYPHHAAWRMEGTMAETPERAQELMMRVWPAAVARVREEVAEQQAIARRMGQNITIEPWDYRYYMERIRRERFNLNQEEIKPYFQLSNMIQGMFHMAGQLYGLRVHARSPARCRSSIRDVRTWRVTRRSDGSEVGIFYGDMFARTGKRSGAWHQAYRIRTRLLGERIVLNSNNNNFVNPGAEPAGADQPRRRAHAVPRIRPRDPLSARRRPLSGPRRDRRATSSNIRARCTRTGC